MQSTSRYFIALIPPDDIAAAITAFKQDMANTYHSKKALRVMPHITLKAPFTVSSSRDAEVAQWFEDIKVTLTEFEVQLDGFRCFDNPKNPVIFVKPIVSDTMNLLQKEILKGFKNHFPDIAIHFYEEAFHPHITVAYRDLSYAEYQKAWKIYSNKPYFINYINRNFYLLKHNNIEWNIKKIRTL